jgi:hypothetical protein
MLPPDLKRLDTHGIPEDKSEIRLFRVVRNESLRMPFYRRMGVMRFFLLAQPDCCVFHTIGSFAAARAGLDWLNPLMVTSKNTPSARPANQIQRSSLNLTTGSGCI